MKKIFKLTLKLVILLIIASIIIVGSIAAYYGIAGYKAYKSVLAEFPLEEKIAELKSSENYVTMDEMPPIYIDAVIAVEDHNYYEHGAVSIVSTVRAIITNLKDKDFTEGGSTITQQVAKNLYFTQEKKIERKVAEMFVAIELEKNYDKDEIFEFYVNCIYFGSGYYNLYDASMGYYGVEPADLSDYQATLIAGVPNAPSVYSPDNDSPKTSQRHKQVLDSMVKYGYLSKEEADKIFNQ